MIATVTRVIEATRISPALLQLEITESMAMGDLDKMATVLNDLRQVGVQLAVDDFGTGHSSLNCLHQFFLDVLKIDRSFVNSMKENKRHYVAILHSIIELAHNFRMGVVVEGVETEDQLTMLLGLSCNYGQGWLFSKPLSAKTVKQFLSRDYHFNLAA